jgi:DNA-binding NarL/FixJ family response regulator
VTSVFIVAAVPALRAGLRAMLEPAGLQVVGDAPAPPADAGPGVLLLAGDVNLEDLPETQPIVLLSDDASQAAALQGLGLPGWALLPADSSADRLVAAVHAVALGLVVLAGGEALAMAPAVQVSEPLQEPLTPRELEVLQLVSHGLSNKLVARALNISEHTVKFHVSSTYAKLGAASRTEAVSLAARKGLISL